MPGEARNDIWQCLLKQLQKFWLHSSQRCIPRALSNWILFITFFGTPMVGGWKHEPDFAQLQVSTILWNFEQRRKNDHQFQRKRFIPWTRPMGKWPWSCTATFLYNSIELRRKIRQTISEIVFRPWSRPQGRMGKWPCRCTGTGQDNSIEIRTGENPSSGLRDTIFCP